MVRGNWLGVRSAMVAACATAVLAVVASTASAAAPDWTGDGAGDVVAVDSDGSLRVYRGSGTGLFTDAGPQIDGPGNGWGEFRDVFSTADFTGDGKPDVFVRTTDGGLRVYRGNGAGGLLDNGTLIGNGWGGHTSVIAPGDFSGDGKPDVLARASDGAIILYRGDGFGGVVDNGLVVNSASAGWAGSPASTRPVTSVATASPTCSRLRPPAG